MEWIEPADAAQLTHEQRRAMATNLLLDIFNEHDKIDDWAVEQAAKWAHVHPRTVRKWVRAAQPPEEQKPLGTTVKSGFVFDVWWKTLVVAYLGNLYALWEDACALQEQGQIDNLPSYPTFTRLARRQLKPSFLEGARKGGQHVRNKMLYVAVRKTKRNQSWQIDATGLPIRIKYKLLNGSWVKCKPWLTVVIDEYSRLIMGFIITPGQPTEDDVAGLLVAAFQLRKVKHGKVKIGGLPDKLICDNGKQFISGLIQAASAKLGFVNYSTAIYAPREKGKVEVWFRTLKNRCIGRYAGYVRTQDMQGKQVFDAKKNEEHVLLDDVRLLKVVGDYVDRYNFKKVHRELGCTPYEQWCADDGFVKKISREELRLGLMRADKTCLVTSGKFWFKGQRWAGKDIPVDGSIRVHYLHHNDNWVEAHTPKGKYLCRCYPEDRVPHPIKMEMARGKEEEAADFQQTQHDAHLLRMDVNRAVRADSEVETPTTLEVALERLGITSSTEHEDVLGADADASAQPERPESTEPSDSGTDEPLPAEPAFDPEAERFERARKRRSSPSADEEIA